MKIIEALKEFPLLEKRIEKNIELVQKYSSELDLGKAEYTFGSNENQTKEVTSLLQSTDDLIARRAKLRRALAVTNAKIKVTILGKERTITEWIEYREKGCDLQVKALNALNDKTASLQLQANQGKLDLAAGVRVVRFYDEKEKNEKANKLMEEKSVIDASLEIVNATTDLTEEV
jgi:hypothetical protein